MNINFFHSITTHSYACDDYVLNDNAAGDIKILRNCLQAISPFNNSIKKEPSEESSFEKNKDSLKHNSIDSSLQLSPDLTPIDSNDNSKSTSANRRRSSRVQKCNSNSIYHYKKYAYFYNNDVTSFLMEQASQSFQKISKFVLKYFFVFFKHNICYLTENISIKHYMCETLQIKIRIFLQYVVYNFLFETDV